MAKSPQSEIERALEFYQSGKLLSAERLTKKVLRHHPQQPDCRHLLGLIAFQKGKFDQAVRQIHQAVSTQPDNPTFLCNLGAAQLECGALSDAIASYEQAIVLRPNYPQALANLGLAYGQVGNLVKAEAALRRVIEVLPDDATAYFNLANCLVEQGLEEQAIDAFKAALERNENYGEARSNLAAVFRKRGDFARALEQLHEATNRDPDNYALRYNLANTFHQSGRLDAARDNYLAAIEMDPANIEARINLAAVLVDLARPGKAIELYRACIATRPDDVPLRANLASLLEQVNLLAEAREHLDVGLGLVPHDARLRMLEARFKRRDGDPDGARVQLNELLTEPLPPDIEAEVAIELGGILDRIGVFADAFETVRRGHRAVAALEDRRYDLGEYRTRLVENGLWFDRERVSRASDAPPEMEEEPIFFVGFPRSGTTLVEQILSSHPDVETSAEANVLASTIEYAASIVGTGDPYPNLLADLSADQIVVLRDHYWRQAANLGWVPDRRWVDKLPLNIVHLGFVRWIFPRAKILVALRDPRDVAISCFMQSFRPNAAMAHFLDIATTADLYATVMELWLHFRDALSADWMTYRYEDLVADPEAVVRRIVEHLDLAWTDDILDHSVEAQRRVIATPSYADVTQPIYARAVGRWHNYREQLAPVLPKLEPFVSAFGYEPS